VGVGDGTLEAVVNLLRDAFAGKRVLVTGHTGFKGSWLCAWLHSLGAEVFGLALQPDDDMPLFGLLKLGDRVHHRVGDIRDPEAVRIAFEEARPEFVFHLAAQALVLRSYQNPIETFSTNVIGSANVLEACRSSPETRALVFITTDKCYQNREWVWGYREIDPLGGDDPYSASKACAEIVFGSYVRSFLSTSGTLSAASVRAGNVIGGGDYSADRLIPDCIRALTSGKPILVRNPHSTRPWQHVLDPLGAYLLLGAKLTTDPSIAAGSWNVGPDMESNRTVVDVVNEVIGFWGEGEVHIAARTGAPPESTLLHLNCDKIRHAIGWRPTWGFTDAIRHTVAWYREVTSGSDPWKTTMAQIDAYSSTLAWRGVR
jgi:CDP-glucose 4,6-dehydratase